MNDNQIDSFLSIIQHELSDLYSQFMVKLRTTYHYQSINYITATVMLIIENDIDESILNDDIRQAIDEYKRNIEEIKSCGSNYFTIIYEKMLIDSYQAFEEFIANIFTILLTHFPKFLVKNSSDKKIIFSYDEIFNSPNIEYSKNFYIDRKVKDIIQNNNIIEIIKYFDKIFALTMKIDSEKLNIIYTMSKLRNILIHNDGKINIIFINDLNKYNIQHDYIINDSISKNIEKDTDMLRQLVYDLSDLIYEELTDKLNQIKLYHDNL